ncbi:AmmeMemoRadiSam system radical SAM enzyme [Candidatus Marsarchaeota archaeon]|nr:AmmeMemoRadiSam system radical SAM enzyme [Candidatus Marsarchaeota archaeon]MCL5404893.1 AmmeMemoRadiSam system radical SAM enzyme [Candidatus Marsarchaeota archaeon]
MIKKALLWEEVSGKVRCNACSRRCLIPNGGHGFCYVRKNIEGELYLANYGILDAIQLDPIEKKPFNHYMPGTAVLGVGTSSCNFGCMFCQNHNISKESEVRGVYLGPEDLVKLALEQNADGIAFTYNEPTIFIEYALDAATEAHKHGLYAVFVSNGYMTKEAIDLMKGKIDAVVVDFKGNAERIFTNKYMAVYSEAPIKEALVALKDAGIHIEITDLVIPGVGDSDKACTDLCSWIVHNLGTDVPLHFTRFHPDYKMDYIESTPLKTLERHYSIAKSFGMKYVYIGNVPGHKYENTYCPKCGSLAIKRFGFSILEYNLNENGECINCGEKIGIISSKPVHLKNAEIRTLY